MIVAALESLWHFLFGWAGIDMLAGFACIAVAVCETWIINSLPPILGKFIPDLRKWAIGGAVVAFTCMGCIAYGFKNGLDEKQRQWDAAIAREAVSGEKIRSDVERSIPRTDDRSMFDNDPDNRDRDGQPERGGAKGPLRWLAKNPLLGKSGHH